MYVKLQTKQLKNLSSKAIELKARISRILKVFYRVLTSQKRVEPEKGRAS